jgi:hypothetical protein
MRMVQSLRDLGRLEPIDDARVVAFIELARAVDSKPTDASLWKQYRDAEVALRETDNADDPLADLFAALRDSSDTES